jgi:hypothetical protein
MHRRCSTWCRRLEAVRFVFSLMVVIASVCWSRELLGGSENQTFTFPAAADFDIRVVSPRGWRNSTQPGYPGVLLWMQRASPEGLILFSADRVDDQVRRTWPVRCREQSDLASGYACALSEKMTRAGFRVEAPGPGPAHASLPTVIVDYHDKKWVRHAVMSTGDWVFGLVVSVPTLKNRAVVYRSFDQVLRSVAVVPREPAAPEAGGDDAATQTPASM